MGLCLLDLAMKIDLKEERVEVNAVLPIGPVKDREKLLSVCCTSNGSKYLPDNVECFKIVFICFFSKSAHERERGRESS